MFSLNFSAAEGEKKKAHSRAFETKKVLIKAANRPGTGKWHQLNTTSPAQAHPKDSTGQGEDLICSCILQAKGLGSSAPHFYLKPAFLGALSSYFCCSSCSLKLFEPPALPSRAAVHAAEGTGPAGSGNNPNCHLKNNFQFIPFSVQLRWELN